MDLSGLISSQCCTLLVSHGAFFPFVFPNDYKGRALSKCHLAVFSALFISTLDNLVVFFVFLEAISFLGKNSDVSKRWFHKVQCPTVLSLLFQSASYLLCHYSVF